MRFIMRQKLFAALFTLAVMVIVCFNVMADGNTSKTIEEEESRVNENQEKLDNIQSLLTELNSSKNDLDEYLAKLNESYNAISSYIEELDIEKQTKQSEIESINLELERAEIEQTDQYEAMKLRIKYMYETGDSGYINALFSDESLSEILNKVEYTAQLLEYDRTKLEEYEQLLTYIAATKLQLEEELEKLEQLVNEQQEQKRQMSDMMAQAAENIRSKEAEIDEAESRAEALAKEIQEGKESIEELKAEESRRIEESIRQSIEQASREAAGIQEESTTSQPYEASEEDVMKLAAIMYCEARGEPYEGILAVGTVVMNRVADPRFPNTVEEVIMSPGQFSPVASGHYAIALSKGANETCIKAAREVLYDNVRTGPWLYFRTINNIIQGTIIGNHVFYYR